MLRLLFLLIVSSFSLSAISQNEEDNKNTSSLSSVKTCAYDAVEIQYSEEDASYQRKKKQERKDFRAYLNIQNVSNTRMPVYSMPVVVHIIHAGSEIGSQANPLDETIRNTVEVASSRFRHAHSGAGSFANPNYGADTEIELCLANVDPDGNYTTGVTRHYSPSLAIGTYQDVASGLDAFAWDKSKYINLYIITDLTNASGVYLGGFDFTIYTSAGGFWSGLIAHELGHYFNLDHIFTPQNNCINNDCTQDGDGICDTPPKSSSGFSGGECNNPANSCTTDDDDTSNNNPYRPVVNGGMGDQPDMLANYMDYTGGCWDAFTIEQKAKMRMNISQNRLGISGHASIACASPSLPSNEIAIKGFTITQENICSSNFDALIKIENLGTQVITTATLRIERNGNLLLNYSWTGNLAAGAEADIILSDASLVLNQGDNLLNCNIENINGSADINLYDNVAYIDRSLFFDGSCDEINACTNFSTGTNNVSPTSTLINFTGSLPEIDSNSDGPLICVKVQGDVSFSGETFSIFGENAPSPIYATTNFGSDCSGYTSEVCFQIPASDYQNWKSDGTITLTLTPISSEINPNLCVNNEACARIIIPEPSACTGTVTMSSNDGLGSLRQNIDCMIENGIISLDYTKIPDTIILTSPIILDKNLTIKSLNGSEIIIKAAPSSPVFRIENGVEVTLEGFKILASPQQTSGTALINNGSLNLNNVSILESTEDGVTIQNNGDLNVEGTVKLVKNQD